MTNQNNNKFTSLLNHGFNPFALPYGSKEPNSSWMPYQSERVTPEQCKKWDVGRHNVAIATGNISKIFVVDIDGEKGRNTLQRLEDKNGPLPQTVTVKTSRGKHLYFINPKDRNIRNLAGFSSHGEEMEGIDVRGNGGYVVAPHSKHPDGSFYEWELSPDEVQIAESPDWMLDLVVQPEYSIKNNAIVNEPSHLSMEDEVLKQCQIIEATKEGSRNAQLNKSAFYLGQHIHLGWQESNVIKSLTVSALKIGLGEREIESTVSSGLKGGKKSPRIMDRWNDPDMSIINRPKVILPECPHHLLGKTLERFVNEAAMCKCAPPDYIFAGLLCAAAGLIGNARKVKVWEGWTEPTSLWLMFVGVPSCNKSPALDAIFPTLHGFEAKHNKRYQEEMRRYKDTLDIMKANKQSSSVAVVEELDKPVMKRIIVNDTTIEKLALLLADNKKGLIYSRDELAALLANLEKNGGNDRPFYLESFGGRPMSIDRVKHGDVIYVPSVLLSIIGSIQPERLDSLLIRQPDDGLASRFLYISGTPRKLKKPDVKPDYEMLQNMLQKLESLEVPLDENDIPNPTIVPFCSEGCKLMEKLGDRLQSLEQEGYGLITSHIGKLRGIAARLSLVLHYLEWSAIEADEASNVDIRHVESAVYMVEHYFYPMSRHCLSSIAMPQDEQDALIVAKWILNQKTTVINARDVHRDIIPSRDIKRRDPALLYLEECGWIKRQQSTGKSVNYDVNPRVFEV